MNIPILRNSAPLVMILIRKAILRKIRQNTGFLLFLCPYSLYKGRNVDFVLLKKKMGQNRKFCPYTGEYKSEKTRILAYFMQHMF